MTENFGLNKHEGAREDRQLDASEHVERQSHVGADGLSIMDAYNYVLPRTAEYRRPGGVT